MNRALAVLSNMLTFALDKGMIEIHPWCDIDVYPEERRAICVMTVAEERALVEATLRKDLAVGFYCGLLGETAMRPEEGLRQQWSFVNLSQRLLTGDKSKTKKARHIPLSDYAMELLQMVPRIGAGNQRLAKGDRAGVASHCVIESRGSDARPTGFVTALRHYVGIQIDDQRVKMIRRWIPNEHQSCLRKRRLQTS